MTYLKNKINKQVTVNVKLTPDDWDLFTREPEVERIAETLNEKFNLCVNSLLTREETARKMQQEMWNYRAWGASDSEPLYVLEQLLNEVYQ